MLQKHQDKKSHNPHDRSQPKNDLDGYCSRSARVIPIGRPIWYIPNLKHFSSFLPSVFVSRSLFLSLECLPRVFLSLLENCLFGIKPCCFVCLCFFCNPPSSTEKTCAFSMCVVLAIKVRAQNVKTPLVGVGCETTKHLQTSLTDTRPPGKDAAAPN